MNDDLMVGLMGPMLTIGIANRKQFKSTFDKLLEELKNKSDTYYYLFCKLYKKYLTVSDAEEIIKVDLDEYKSNFSDDEIVILDKIHKSVLDLYRQMLFMIENNEDPKVLKLALSDIPYFIYDRMLPLEAYDDLTDKDEPFWMRDVSDFIQKR
ncbi:hypothetical protein [Moraxella marmotae]|uniref:hypothetical protein n=1 Tax=Moraxella marmotae TaxID=3344520 RepID=UPI0035F3DCC8